MPTRPVRSEFFAIWLPLTSGEGAWDPPSLPPFFMAAGDWLGS
jgi:hypothetical protein